MWSPFSQSFSLVPQQALGQQTGFTFNAQSHDTWKIDLPGGGFIEKPGTEPRSPAQNHPLSPSAQFDEFTTPEERNTLLGRLDMLLEERAARERALQDLFAQETSLHQTLSEVNAALDIQDGELSQLTESVRIKKEEMMDRIETKKLKIANLQETLRELHREETRTASYRIRAAEGRALRRQISRGYEERKVLQYNVDELDKKAELLEIRCKTIDTEEKTVLKNISEEMQRLAEDGFIVDFPKQCYIQENNDIMVQAELHHEPKKNRPALQPVQRMIKHCEINLNAQLSEKIEQPQLAVQIEVPEDNGALSGNVKKRGFLSSVKKLFRRRPNPGSAHKKRSKKELAIKVMYDSKPSGTVTMVTLSQAKNLHKAADEQGGETSAQENHQISVKS